MIDRVMFFLADNIATIMTFSAGWTIYYGISNKNSQVTTLGCTLAIIAMMITIFV